MVAAQFPFSTRSFGNVGPWQVGINKLQQFNWFDPEDRRRWSLYLAADSLVDGAPARGIDCKYSKNVFDWLGVSWDEQTEGRLRNWQ